MIKKIIYISIILCLFMLNIAYATDIVMDLNNNASSIDNSNQTIDNTIYSDTQVEDYLDSEYDDVASTTTTEYEDSGELSITNMINIILAVVGVVLILLGIAIIIKLK